MRFVLNLFRPLVAMLAISIAGNAIHADESAKPTAKAPPKVGDKAEMFTLQSLDGEKVELKKLLKQGPVVVAVLRGYPGYQCPACTRQVGGYVKLADDFAQANATVLVLVVSLLPLVSVFNQSGEAPWHLWVPALAQSTLMNRVLRGESIGALDLVVPAVLSLLLTALCLAWLARQFNRAAVK